MEGRGRGADSEAGGLSALGADGWGAVRDARRASGISRRKQSQLDEEAREREREEGRSQQRHADRGVEMDILEIPELADEEENLQKQVAQAPRGQQNRVQCLEELDGEALEDPEHVDKDLDLSVLKLSLLPPSAVHEEPVPWSSAKLILELRAELEGGPGAAA